MPDTTKPVTVTASDINPDRAPRTISHAEMDQNQQDGLATHLSPRERHRMFIRYDNAWWIADTDGFTEITSATHNAKLDRWHERLTNGALWK